MYIYMYFIVFHVQLYKICLYLFAEVSGNVMNVRQGLKGRQDQKLLEERPERAREVRGASCNRRSIDSNGTKSYIILLVSHQILYASFCF